MDNEYYPFVNLPLEYSYSGLEPYIDEQTMRVHHNKLLQNYVNKLNTVVEENPFLKSYSLTQMIINSARLNPELQRSVRNNAGGVFNHRFYFNGMAASGQDGPSGMLLRAIENCFGNYENFKEEFKSAAAAVFGSGYTWLIYDRGRLKIVSTANQNSPVEFCLCPILAVDVWEHAYFLKHYNLRADYIDDWFKVINWDIAEEKYFDCTH
jgi:Fe-Mn family superoxide dismutase